MPRSPFTLAFDHVDSCSECRYSERRLCSTGRALFEAACDAAKLIAGFDDTTPRAKA